MSTEENKELIRRVTEEVYSQGKLDAVDRYYAPDWLLHDAPPNAGGDRQSLKEVLGVIRGGFPDVHASIEVILAEGDLVAYRTTAEGTHTREYFGVAPTGKRVTLRQLSIDRVRDGRIVESWSESFGQGFHYQLTGKAPRDGRREVGSALAGTTFSFCAARPRGGRAATSRRSAPGALGEGSRLGARTRDRSDRRHAQAL